MTKAVVIHQFGGPEVLRYEDRPVGTPATGQVLLRQTAIGLNFVDVYGRSGHYDIPRPFVGGMEGVGVVAAIGTDVTEVKVGDRVAYSSVWGGYAAERLIEADQLIPLPDTIDDATAAAVTLKGLTAYFLMLKTYEVGPQTTLLYHAAAGGVGLLATQWAKALGATVIGTVGNEAKADIARLHGCDHVINYRTENFVARVREITGGRGVDVVYDGVGGETFERSLDCLRPRGLLVSIGNASGVSTLSDVSVFAGKGCLYITRASAHAHLATREQRMAGAEALFDVISTGAVKVRIDKTFPLANVALAHEALEGRQTTGSVVLVP